MLITGDFIEKDLWNDCIVLEEFNWRIAEIELDSVFRLTIIISDLFALEITIVGWEE